MTLERDLNEANLILEVLQKLHGLAEITPELQEGEREQIIRDFRIETVNFLLAKLKRMNQEYEPYKNKSWA